MQGVLHVDTALHLPDQQGRDAVALGFFAAQAVKQHRNAHFAKGFGGKALCQGIPGGSHQTGVERSAHLERDAPAGTDLLCKLRSLVHGGLFAANDQLARAIVVTDLHTAQR